MLLSYKENENYYLGMYSRNDGDCEIRLYKKINENHGSLIYSKICREFSKNEDFKKYYEIESLIENNENDKLENYKGVNI